MTVFLDTRRLRYLSVGGGGSDDPCHNIPVWAPVTMTLRVPLTRSRVYGTGAVRPLSGLKDSHRQQWDFFLV